MSSLVSVDLANGPRVHLAQWGSPLFAPVTFATAPVIAGDRVIIEDSSGNVYAVNRSTTTGNADWTFATNLTFARGAPVVIGGQVLVPTDNGILLALDVVSGHEVFQSAYAGGQLHYPAPVGTDRVIFTRGGPRPGLVTFINDPNGAALTDIVSPTAANYGKILGDFAIAAAAILLLALLLFRPMARRMGPAFFIEDGEATQAAVEDQG